MTKLSQARRQWRSKVILVAINEGLYECPLPSLSCK